MKNNKKKKLFSAIHADTEKPGCSFWRRLKGFATSAAGFSPRKWQRVGLQGEVLGLPPRLCRS